MEKKIIEYKAISSHTLEDWDANLNIQFQAQLTEKHAPNMQPGLNSMANELIKQGFVPNPETKLDISYSERYTIPGTYATGGGGATYIREFIKYEQWKLKKQVSDL